MSSAVELKTKEEKDAELDKRIEALRKKNEALVKRYQEIQEDKKKAEQEGIAVTTPRKPRPHEPESERRKPEKENFTMTDDSSKVAVEKRVVNDRKPTSNRGDGPEEGESGWPHGECTPNRTSSSRLSRGFHRGGRREPRPIKGEPRPDRQPQDNEGGDGPVSTERTPRGGRRGRGGGGTPGGSDKKSKEWEERRRQNIEKMNEEMEKIAEFERGQQADGEKYPIRNFLDDPRRSGPIPEVDRTEGSRRHMRNYGGVDFYNVKTGAEVEKEWTQHRRPSGRGSADMTLSMTGRERAEYLRWKQEREQIDEERLARHRNATGQWRREWDAQKTDTMFREEAPAVAEEGTPEQSNRREDAKRPPKIQSFGDFLGQGKPRQGGRGGGKVRGQGQSYSMHDNRWEGEHEEEKGRKEEQETEKGEKDKENENEKKDEKVKAPSSEKTDDGGLAQDDEDEWEDASDHELDEGEEELENTEHEEEVKECPKDTKPTEKSSTSSGPSTPSPKERRTPRPKVHIPSPQEVLSTPEGPKPISPFFPLDNHQPVSDWGEEMEMMSPKCSLGESPLRPSSSENSPAQSNAERNTTSSPSKAEEPEKSENTSAVMESTTCETQQEEVPAKSTENATSSQDTAEAAVQDTPDSTRQMEDSEAPAVEPDQSQPESKTTEEVTADQSDQAFSE